MSSSGLNFKGRPQSEAHELKDDVTQFTTNIRVFRFCGGLGGGGCVIPVGSQYVIWAFKVSKHVTYNRKVVFHNPEFTGVRIYSDGGPDIFCTNSLGSEVSFWMGLSASASADPETTAKAGVQLSGALPYDIEFSAQKCPQPTDAAWNSIIYAYLWFDSPDVINEGSTFGTIDNPSMKLVQHDNDSRI